MTVAANPFHRITAFGVGLIHAIWAALVFAALSVGSDADAATGQVP